MHIRLRARNRHVRCGPHLKVFKRFAKKSDGYLMYYYVLTVA